MTNKKNVLKIFPGSKVIAEPEISESDWLAIRQEVLRWFWDEKDKMWKENFSPPPDSHRCRYCVKAMGRRIARGDIVSRWRRYGKIVERLWADGHSDLFCSFCGREHGESDE